MSVDKPKPSFEKVLGEFLAAVDAGECPDPQAFIDQHEHISNELREFFENDRWLAATNRASATSKSGPALGAHIECLPGTRLGHYQIIEVLAHGGMGVVCRAKHDLMQREVAIKLLLAGALAGAEEIQRLRCEAEAVARLDHPNIVPIYEVGLWGEQPYLVMPLLDSTNLQQQIESITFSTHQTAELVRDLANAVVHAHERGVIHRDLKPSNVLLSADGRPMLVDFGLAKGPRSESWQTATGRLLGIPHYMSPEQAKGITRVGPATDVFGLGSILYALLTGKPPHQGDSVMAVIQSILDSDIDPPSSAQISIPRDLQAICMKCLEREVNDRYASARELAEDLQRFLDGEPTIAGRSSTIDAFTRPLFRDTHRATFGFWGRWLLSFGSIIFFAHVMMFVLRVYDFPFVISYVAPRATMFVALFAAIYWSRSGRLSPRTMIERPVWSIWIAYLAALAAANILALQWDIELHQLFAITSILAGTSFFATGGSAWGGCYLIGLAFIVLGLLVGYLPAPEIWFGGTWFTALAILARRYWSL